MSEETKVCSKCGAVKPATKEYYVTDNRLKCKLSSRCKLCKKKYDEQNKEQAKRRNDARKEEKRQYNKAYQAAHIDERREYDRKRHEERLESENRRCREYRELHKEEQKIRAKTWQTTHLAQCRINGQRRYMAKKRLPATLTLPEWEQAKQYFDNRCCYCGSKEALKQDHFVPIHSGGAYTLDNIVPACQRCNSSKKDKAFSKWYPKQKYYSKKREQAIMLYLNQSHVGEQIEFETEEQTER